MPPARATFRKMLHSSSLVSMGCVTTVAFVPVQRTTFRPKSHLGDRGWGLFFVWWIPRQHLAPRVSSSKRETQRGSLSPKGNLLIFWVLGLSTKKIDRTEPLRKWNGEVSHQRQWLLKVITSWGLLWNQTENGYMNNNYISCVWCHHGSISILTTKESLWRWLGQHHCSDTNQHILPAIFRSCAWKILHVPELLCQSKVAKHQFAELPCQKSRTPVSFF